MLQRIVGVAIAIVVGIPLVYYASILGAHVGFRFSIYSNRVIPEHTGFVVGAVVGCVAAVFSAGFVAIGAARVTGRLLSSVHPRDS